MDDQDDRFLTGEHTITCPICLVPLKFIDVVETHPSERSTRWRCEYCETDIPIIVTVTEIIGSVRNLESGGGIDK